MLSPPPSPVPPPSFVVTWFSFFSELYALVSIKTNKKKVKKKTKQPFIVHFMWCISQKFNVLHFHSPLCHSETVQQLTRTSAASFFFFLWVSCRVSVCRASPCPPAALRGPACPTSSSSTEIHGAAPTHQPVRLGEKTNQKNKKKQRLETRYESIHTHAFVTRKLRPWFTFNVH